MIKKKVMLVEDDVDERAAIGKIFSESGHHVATAGDGLSAYQEILKDRYDLIVSELNLPRMSGLDLLKRIREVKRSVPVILISDQAGVNEAVEAMKLGANDFILKPLTLKMIEIMTAQAGSNGKARGKPESKFTIITKNKEMNRLLAEAREIADSRASILIQGDSGTGKELFARYVHGQSNRKTNPFVAINCAALPETLLESELFGHEKGSFTGAVGLKKGKFELANHGTILLDEISEMDPLLQAKLLRVIQEKEIDRLGGTAGPIPVDVRIIATTNRDIEKQIEEKGFREDLFYRLNVIPVHLPPLRERRDDIALLAEHFIGKYNKLDNRAVNGLTDEAKEALMQMPWKGNVRELENVIERAVLRCKKDLIDKDDFNLGKESSQVGHVAYPLMPPISLREMEKKVIFNALDETNGNRTHAAEILGISVRTLRNKLNEYKEKMEAG